MAAPTKDSVSSSLGTIAICGNPNCGKTTIFNRMTGLNQQVGNYPGVTVEKVVGSFSVEGASHASYSLVDIPGAYSLSAMSPDERIAAAALHGSIEGSTVPDAIICVIDATNLERGLYFLLQIIQIGQPVIAAINMVDLARRKGIEIDVVKLSAALGGMPVVELIGSKGKGINQLKEAVATLIDRPFCVTNQKYDGITEELLREIAADGTNGHRSRAELLRIIFDVDSPAQEGLEEEVSDHFKSILKDGRRRLKERYGVLSSAETGLLMRRSETICKQVTKLDKSGRRSLSDQIDRFVLNPVLGPVLLVGLMIFVFQSIFSWSQPFMELIDSIFGSLAGVVEATVSEGPLQSLLVDGIVGGVGSVLVFIPQIAILFLFIALLEDSGYMARGAFLVDRMFRWCGLSGKSFIPMLSSFACAVPGIMATRTIEDRKLRFITIIIAPLMTCSARLPVYSIMIAAFVPFNSYFGIFNLPGLVLTSLYLLGIVVAIIVSLILNRLVFKAERGTFLMEMPSYKVPTAKSVAIRVFNRLRLFILRAGSVILAITVIIWALSYYPRSDTVVEPFKQQLTTENERFATGESFLLEKKSSLLNNRSLPVAGWLEDLSGGMSEAGSVTELSETRQRYLSDFSEHAPLIETVHDLEFLRQDHAARVLEIRNVMAGEYLRHSFFAQMGRAVEPIFVPLGWDWKITMAVLSSFPAREVIIATIGTIYNLGGEVDEESSSLIDKMRLAKWEDGPKEGQPVFTTSVALSIMVFFALCCQCGATLVTIRQETSSWGYPVFVFTYMTVLAYVAAYLTFRFSGSIGL